MVGGSGMPEVDEVVAIAAGTVVATGVTTDLCAMGADTLPCVTVGSCDTKGAGATVGTPTTDRIKGIAGTDALVFTIIGAATWGAPTYDIILKQYLWFHAARKNGFTLFN